MVARVLWGPGTACLEGERESSRGQAEGRRWAPSPGHRLSHQPPAKDAQALPRELYLPGPGLQEVALHWTEP